MSSDITQKISLDYIQLCGTVYTHVGCRTCDQQVAGSNSSRPILECNPGQLNTRASVTRQYNLVPANGWWCLAAGKVTIGPASHWPRITDISGSPSTGSRSGRGRWTPTMLSCAWVTLPLHPTVHLAAVHFFNAYTFSRPLFHIKKYFIVCTLCSFFSYSIYCFCTLFCPHLAPALQLRKPDTAFLHYLNQEKKEIYTGTIPNMRSLFMPTSKHFFNRQCGQNLRVFTSILQLPSKIQLVC